MKTSYNWIQSHFKEKLPSPEKLAELLTMHSQEVENIEEKKDDFIFDVKVTPDRSYDYIDFLGIVRDIAAVLKININIKLPEPKGRESIFVKESYFEKILGVKISEKEIIDILNHLGMEIGKKNGFFSVGVPLERPDLKIKEDIVEEVARVYGYDKIEEIIPEGALFPPKRNNSLFFAEVARKILTGLGYSEVYNYSFAKDGGFELENPVSKDRKFLRANLTDGLLANVKENSKYFKNTKIFEIGKIFPKEGETLSLAVASSRTDFYEIKGVMDNLLEGLRIADFYYKESADKVADIRIGNTDIGVIDHNHFELNFEELVRLADEKQEYSPISKYPAIVRDIAVFVLINEKVESVLDIIENTAGKLLIDTDLFDIYENKERKSLAFHLIFQSPDKTLTDGEVNIIMEKIFTAMEVNDDWEVRK